MIRQFIFFMSLCSITSCVREHSKTKIDQGNTNLDTLVIFDRFGFSECSKVVYEALVFDMLTPSIKITDINKENGLIYKKEFIRKDSVLLKLFFENIKFYDENIMFRSSEGLTGNTIFHDTLIELPNLKLSKSFAIEGEMASLNYVMFDSFGYLHLNIIDNRKIPFEMKEENIEKIFSSFKKIKIQIPAIQIIGSIDSSTQPNKCSWCENDHCRFISKLEHDSTNEILVLINPDDISSTIDLDMKASCIVNNYGLQSRIGNISFVVKASSPNLFNRIAIFCINKCITQVQTECEQLNFVDCIWIDESFAKKLYSEEDCERWQMGR